MYSSRLPKAKGLLELKFRQGPDHIGNTLTCEGLDPLGDDLCHVVEQVPPSPRDWRYILHWECWAMGKVGSWIARIVIFVSVESVGNGYGLGYYLGIYRDMDHERTPSRGHHLKKSNQP